MNTDRRHLLKLKLKSLAAEARIIRHHESKLAFRPDSERLCPEAIPEEVFALGEKACAAWIKAERRDQRKQWQTNPWFVENRERLTSMRNHRVVDVREESRATHLAYGFIRGKTARQIEGNRMLGTDLLGNPNQYEQRVLEKAHRMAWFYSAIGSKADAKKEFNTWLTSKDVFQQNGGLFPAQLPAPPSVPPSDLGALL